MLSKKNWEQICKSSKLSWWKGKQMHTRTEIEMSSEGIEVSRVFKYLRNCCSEDESLQCDKRMREIEELDNFLTMKKMCNVRSVNWMWMRFCMKKKAEAHVMGEHKRKNPIYGKEVVRRMYKETIWTKQKIKRGKAIGWCEKKYAWPTGTLLSRSAEVVDRTSAARAAAGRRAELNMGSLLCNHSLAAL